MDRVVYATFETRESADAHLSRLMTRHQGMGPFSGQLHASRLDPLTLPDAGTVLGRNTVIYVVGGVCLGMVSGLAAALILPVLPGLGGWTFPVAGTVAGAFVGILCAAMAGAREPKRAIKEAATALQEGRFLLTVLVHNGPEREHVVGLLQDDAEEIGVC